MHSNVHYALGVLIASIAQFFFSMNIWLFLVIIVTSIIADADIFAYKLALNEDHRNFFTHSIYPTFLLFLVGIPVGILWNIHVVWISGIAYGTHIFLDCIDWKIRMFYGKKQYGWAFLITEDEKNLGRTRKELQLESGMDVTSFAIDRYFHNTTMLVIGITLALVAFLILFVLASEYWYVFIGYFFLLEIYLYQKKKMESKYKD